MLAVDVPTTPTAFESKAVVGLRLHLGARVDVHDDERAGMLGLPGAQFVGGDRIRQQQPRRGRGSGTSSRRQDGGGLGHEVHRRRDDRGLLGGRGLAGRGPASRRRSGRRPWISGTCSLWARMTGVASWARRRTSAWRPATFSEHDRSVVGRRLRAESRGREFMVGSRVRDRSSADAEWVSAPIG